MNAKTTTLIVDAPELDEQRTEHANADAAPAPHTGEGVAPAAARGSENAFAITSFVLGIASIVSSWTFIAPIVGLVLGVLALRRKTTERTLALWGVWMNAAMLAVTVLAVLVVLLVLGVGAIASLPIIAG